MDNQRSIWSACYEDALVVETLRPTEDPIAWRELKSIYEASFDVDIQRSDLDQQVEDGKETAFVARMHRDDSCFQWLSSFVLKRQRNVVGFTAVRPLQVESNEALLCLNILR